MAIESNLGDSSLLANPSDTHHVAPDRTPSCSISLPTFDLPRGDKRHYQQQFADMYFARLAQLKPAVETVARDAWASFEIAGEPARRVERVLDVRQGELCWVVGTIYMEMALKPNVLEDIGKEHWIAAPPVRARYVDGERDQIMLEDESGRLRLTGLGLRDTLLVTGVILAVVGTENKDGDFEVLDIVVPDLPRQPSRWENEDADDAVRGKKLTQGRRKAGKVAIVSGLGISGDQPNGMAMDLLMEFLLGEATGPEDQRNTANISRLIIAGNSLAHGSPIPTREDMAAQTVKNRSHKKYGYDSTTYNAAPTEYLDLWLATLLPSIPITLIPGENDPTSTALPQPPIHPAMFPHSRAYMSGPSGPTPQDPGCFASATNPAAFSLDGHLFLGTGGQNLDDIARYVSSNDRLEMMEAMLRWRLVAPTAPDTLWCYPFQDGDAFVMQECPHLFFVGNQPQFETAQVEGPAGQRVRTIAVPRFRDTGEIVVLDLENLDDIQVMKFEVLERD